MRTALIVKRLVQVALLGAALAAPAMAQMGPGMGGGWGGGPGIQGAMGGQGGWHGMGPGGGRGMMGRGMGPGGGGMMANQNVARGWQLMTPEERTAQQIKMRAVKTYDECKAVQGEHRALMETRAKEKGVSVFTPRGNPCDNLKARGLIQ